MEWRWWRSRNFYIWLFAISGIPLAIFVIGLIGTVNEAAALGVPWLWWIIIGLTAFIVCQLANAWIVEHRLRSLESQAAAQKRQNGKTETEEVERKQKLKQLADDLAAAEMDMVKMADLVRNNVPLPELTGSESINAVRRAGYHDKVASFLRENADHTIMDRIRRLRARLSEYGLFDVRLKEVLSGLTGPRIKAAADALGELSSRLRERI